MVSNDKSVGNSTVESAQYYLPASALQAGSSFYEFHAANHRALLQQAHPNLTAARPLVFMTILPFREPSQGTSEYNTVAMQRYNQIDHDLDQIVVTEKNKDGVEEGAVSTAKALVKQLRSRDLAPPELSWLGTEAILMLWAIGEKKLALTITDGEFAYTLREKKKTVGRESKIDPDTFDLMRLK